METQKSPGSEFFRLERKFKSGGCDHQGAALARQGADPRAQTRRWGDTHTSRQGHAGPRRAQDPSRISEAGLLKSQVAYVGPTPQILMDIQTHTHRIAEV